MPGTDLLLSNAFDELTANVIEARHIGQGVIDGVECEHLAFRGRRYRLADMGRERRASPIPRKYVITSKTLAGAPQYSLKIKEWKTDVPAEADTYVFKPPGRCEEGRISTLWPLMEFDEVPPGTPAGAKK